MERKRFGPYEIARRCHVTPTTVYRWIKSHRLPAFKTGGGHHRVWEEDLLAFEKSLNLSGNTKILIIEDDAVSRRLMARLLGSHFESVEIHEAVDGYDGGFKTMEIRPDLVVLDLLLPCINGIRVCKTIRRSKDLKQTKILAVTAYHIEKSKRVILRAGADAFLAKPFKNDDLLTLVKELLSLRRKTERV
ncbi:MAG: Regulator of RpoS [Elusimicrobia bacterium]|nr:Regulator of RpoS [Elusimicrobiota bacterium]